MDLVSAVIFDFDYTLADSSAGIIQSIEYALDALGLARVTDDQARRTIGLSLPDTLLALHGQEAAPQVEAFSRLFIESSDRIMVGMTHLLPATRGTLATLSRRGFPLAVVSTKYRYRIEAVFEREGIDDFSTIVGGEDVHAHKPDPESLALALARMDREAEAVLYVGDSETDGQAARRAGMPFCAVLSGVTPRSSLARHQPMAILQDVGGLIDLLPSRPGLPFSGSVKN